MKYILTIFFVLILVALPVMAADDVQTYGSFPAQSTVSLIQTCANSTYSYLQAVIIEGDVQLIGKNMTKTGTLYNYSFSNTTTVGHYIASGNCDINGIQTTWNYDFYIKDNSFLLVIIIALATIVLFIFGMYKQDVNITALSNFGMYSLGVWIIISGIDVYKNYVTDTLGTIILGIAFYVSYKVYEGYSA